MKRLWILVLLAAESARGNRMTKQEEDQGDMVMAKVPCACNNKEGILAPKHSLPGISIAADAECSRPAVHTSLTGGRYCSCDKGKARNWEQALGEAQAQADKVLQPKLDAVKAAVVELEEAMGIEIDASALSNVRLRVRRFPRKAGQGLWVCCCQSQVAGKCMKDAEMESSMWRHGFHHQAPLRACEEEEEERTEPTELPSRFSTSAPTTRQDGRENAEGQKAGSDLFRGNASEDGASNSLPVNVLTADLSKTEQQRSARSENRSFLDDIKAHRFQLKVPDAVQAEPRSSKNRSFLDDIKAHRFQLKVPDAVQAEPRSRKNRSFLDDIKAHRFQLKVPDAVQAEPRPWRRGDVEPENSWDQGNEASLVVMCRDVASVCKQQAPWSRSHAKSGAYLNSCHTSARRSSKNRSFLDDIKAHRFQLKVPDAVQAEPRSSKNRSFLDDIKAHRFQLKVPDAVQAEPRTRASGDAFTRALSERLKKVYVATHGEESEESEEEADAEWE